MARRLLVVALFYLLYALPSVAAAQTGFTLRGKVLDATGAAIAGARVATPSGSTVTDQSGEFVLALAPGRHDVTIDSDGFVPTIVSVTAEIGAPWPAGRAVTWAPAIGARVESTTCAWKTTGVCAAAAPMVVATTAKAATRRAIGEQQRIQNLLKTDNETES